MNNMEQRNFEEPQAIVNASESHMALALVIDKSGSMRGAPIQNLNDGLNRFKAEVCKDKQTRDILDIALIAFDTSHTVIQEWCPIEYMDEVNLTAEGGTNMGPALEEALDMVNARSKFYLSTGSVPYRPWIIIISDGAPSDELKIVIDRVKKMEENGKVSVRSLGVGDYNSKILHEICGPKVMKLEGTDFTSFFDWARKSMRSISLSSPHEKPEAVKLSGNVVVDTDWD